MATSNAFFVPSNATSSTMELRGKTKGTPTNFQGNGLSPVQNATLQQQQQSQQQQQQLAHNMMEQQQGLFMNHSQNHPNPLAPLNYLSTISPHHLKAEDAQQQQQLYNMSRIHSNTQARLQPHQSPSFQFYDPLNHVQYYSQQQTNPAMAAAAAAAASWQQQLLTNPYAFSNPANGFPYKLSGVTSGNHQQLQNDNRPPVTSQVAPQLLAQNTNDWLCENAEAREKGKRRKYCPHEVTALVMGVQKYADESCPWSLILRDEELGHLFHGRSGVDLKDKWRTLTKSRPELTSYTENRRIHRKYRPFTSEEEVALLQGVERYHEQRNVWSLILEDKELGAKFNNRSNVQLKDKYRTMKRAGLLKNCPVSALLPSGRRRKTVADKKPLIKPESLKNEGNLQDMAAGQNFTTFLGNPNEHYPYGNDTGNLYGNLINMKDEMTVPMPLNYHRLGNVSSLNVGMGMNLTLLEGNGSTSEGRNGTTKVSDSNTEGSTTTKSASTPNSKLLNTFFVKQNSNINSSELSTTSTSTAVVSTTSSTTAEATVKPSEAESTSSTTSNITVTAAPKSVNRDKPVIICNV